MGDHCAIAERWKLVSQTMAEESIPAAICPRVCLTIPRTATHPANDPHDACTFSTATIADHGVYL